MRARRADAPHFLWHAIWSLFRGRFRFAGRLLKLAFAALTLTACAHQPLTRSCLTQAQYEQLKASEPAKIHNKLTGKADEDTRPLTGSALELRAWGHAMLGTLKICSTDPNAP